MRRIAFIISILLILTGLTHSASAQYYFFDDNYYDNEVIIEVGASGGAMNCLTDIGGRPGIGGRFIKDLNIGNTHPCSGIFIDALFKNKFGIRLEGTYGQVSAYDSILKGVTDIAKERYNRNLNFKSTIREVSAMVEIHPLFIFIDYASRDQSPPRFSPYLLGGISYFSFNPQAKLGTSWIDLQPLSTEGQGFSEYPDKKPYQLKQINIPMGVGIKYEISPLINVRGEFVYRKLNTDYLDDCSTTYIDPAVFYNHLSGSQLYDALLLHDRQIEHKMGPGSIRGKSKYNDAYFSFNVKVSLIFGRQRIRN